MVSGLRPESARRIQAAPDLKEKPLQRPPPPDPRVDQGAWKAATLGRSDSTDTRAQPHAVWPSPSLWLCTGVCVAWAWGSGNSSCFMGSKQSAQRGLNPGMEMTTWNSDCTKTRRPGLSNLGKLSFSFRTFSKPFLPVYAGNTGPHCSEALKPQLRFIIKNKTF